MARHSAAGLLVLVPAIFAPAARAQDTLVAIRDLAPRTLRTEYFTLTADQSVQVSAVGGGPQGRSAVRRFLDHGFFQSKEEKLWDAGVWPGNAWILDARTREVLWELRTAPTRTNEDGLPAFDGVVRLPAGTYAVNYAALFPVSRFWNDQNDWRVKSDKRESAAAARLHGPYVDDGSYHRFRILVRGAGRKVDDVTAQAELDRSVLLQLKGNKPKARERSGFELDRPLRLNVQVVGEREDTWSDYGWIMEAATQNIVWTSRTGAGEPAGGARKNRMAHETLSLRAGRYVAIYATGDSHQLNAWNETPPYDPSSWGLTVRLANEADRNAARTFVYEPIPTASAFVKLTKLGDDELRWQRFSLSHPMELQIFAVGEGRDGMQDYGWIVDASGRAVWRMTYGETHPGGGSEKNRVFSGIVNLGAGSYTAYFVTDGSHSFRDGWNSDEPMDAEYWGITIGPSNPKRDGAAARALDDAGPKSPAELARITRLRGGRRGQAGFTLATRTAVRVNAIGEGTGEMFDYATIEDSAGHEVWHMSYADTQPAGGASKNRRADVVVTLEPGAYTVYFNTDSNHGWEDWNAAPPDDPLSYGVTVYRAPAVKP